MLHKNEEVQQKRLTHVCDVCTKWKSSSIQRVCFDKKIYDVLVLEMHSRVLFEVDIFCFSKPFISFISVITWRIWYRPKIGSLSVCEKRAALLCGQVWIEDFLWKINKNIQISIFFMCRTQTLIQFPIKCVRDDEEEEIEELWTWSL